MSMPRTPAALAVLFLLLAPPARAGSTELVSQPAGGGSGDAYSFRSSISANGRWLAFESIATNLVGDDANDASDIFLLDRKAQELRRVSLDSTGSEADGESSDASLSGSGRFILFTSSATNLVPDDTNGKSDVFLHDRKTGQTRRLSIDSAGQQADGTSSSPALAANGRCASFRSGATNLVAGDVNGFVDVFVHDRKSGKTRLVSVDSAGGQADGDSYRSVISATGRWVAFESSATNLVPDDTNGAIDIFLHDRQTGETRRVSVDSAGGQASLESRNPAISQDGRHIAFQSTTPDLVADDTNGAYDVFVHDRKAGTTARVSLDATGLQADDPSYDVSLSRDGRHVSFGSDASLVAGDVNGWPDVYLLDRKLGLLALVSVDSDGNQATGGQSLLPRVSRNGRYVAFDSYAQGLVAGDVNGDRDVFLRDTAP